MSYKVTCGESCHRNLAHYNEKDKYESRDEVHTYSFNYYQKCLMHLYFGTTLRCFRTNIKFASGGDVKTIRFVWEQLEQMGHVGESVLKVKLFCN